MSRKLIFVKNKNYLEILLKSKFKVITFNFFNKVIFNIFKLRHLNTINLFSFF